MRRQALLALVLVMTVAVAPATATAGAMARVGPGQMTPLYAPTPGAATVNVGTFALDRMPVTNVEFLSFVREHPDWRRDRTGRVLADDGYLGHWAGPVDLGPDARPDQPVTRVSWFAARAYCSALGKRLPTEAEWEFAASAGEKNADGTAEPSFRERILAWYAQPATTDLPAVGQRSANYWGIHDMHGLVWEWVLDFNSTLVSSDSRSGKSADRLQFCGAGAFVAGDKQDYASFMRLAFRSSLEARYTARTLGFRCASDGGATR
jgi:formylglycine-generating enzyme required for sulfatase activity